MITKEFAEEKNMIDKLKNSESEKEIELQG